MVPGANVPNVRACLKQSLEHCAACLHNSCSQGFEMEDNSLCLSGEDGNFYRMAVGAWPNLARLPRRDFYSQRLSAPTISSLKHMEKLVSCLKSTGGYAVVLQQPLGGRGFRKRSNEQLWLLDSFLKVGCGSDKRCRRSTSSGVRTL
eukprot:s91_g49.t1